MALLIEQRILDGGSSCEYYILKCQKQPWNWDLGGEKWRDSAGWAGTFCPNQSNIRSWLAASCLPWPLTTYFPIYLCWWRVVSGSLLSSSSLQLAFPVWYYWWWGKQFEPQPKLCWHSKTGRTETRHLYHLFEKGFISVGEFDSNFTHTVSVMPNIFLDREAQTKRPTVTREEKGLLLIPLLYICGTFRSVSIIIIDLNTPTTA